MGEFRGSNTDKDRLIALLNDFGVEFTLEPYNTPEYQGTAILCKQGKNNSKNLGHIGFYTEFVFDNTSKFIFMGAWE